MTTYICKECGEAVIVTPEGAVRRCGHDDAPIIANMEAEATVTGGLTT